MTATEARLALLAWANEHRSDLVLCAEYEKFETSLNATDGLRQLRKIREMGAPAEAVGVLVREKEAYL